MLGHFTHGQCRALGGELNSLKCPELGQLLYSWFIDCVQCLRSRTDSVMLMCEARYLIDRISKTGYEPTQLPNLDGESGKSWFRRWRKRYGIKFRRRVKHLKVSWPKLLERVRLYLKNVFALRFCMAVLFSTWSTDAVDFLGPKASVV